RDPDADRLRGQARHVFGRQRQTTGEDRPIDSAALPGVRTVQYQLSDPSSLSESSSVTGASESLPRSSIFVISTWTFWPTPATSSTAWTALRSLRLRRPVMCSRPPVPGVSETNAPKLIVLRTVPR